MAGHIENEESEKEDFKEKDCFSLSAFLNFFEEGREILKGNHSGCPLRRARLSTALFYKG